MHPWLQFTKRGIPVLFSTYEGVFFTFIQIRNILPFIYLHFLD